MMIDDLKPLFPKLKNWAGIDAVLLQCEQQKIFDKCQIAYTLATIKHETKNTMLPIEEDEKGRNRVYGHRVWYNAKPYSDVSIIYYGRGFTQNTWREVYRSLSTAAKKGGHSWDFEYHPELLLEIEPSAWASIYGMRTGLYTGVKLSDYFNDRQKDWINARRIINVLDDAILIAGYAKQIYQAIS